MLRAIAAAFVIAYLPGALLYRLPVLNRPARAALSAEERAFWAVVLSAAWSLAGVLLLAGAGVYRFERLLAVNAAGAALALMFWRTRLAYAGQAPRASWSALLPALVIYAGVFVFFPSAEYVIGGKDPGTYVNEGIQVDLTGALFFEDPTVAAIPAEFRDLFLPDHQNPYYYSLRFMGFWIPHWNHDLVIGQFPHLLPASIALGHALDGVRGALGTVGVWAILGLLSVYFLGARLFGRWPAFAAALLLAANVIEVWFGRYPNSEVAMQAFLFAAVLAFARALEGSQAFFGAVTAVLLGLLLFLRYDALLAFAAFGAAAALAPVTRQRVGLVFGAVLLTLGGVGYWYLQVPMIGYSAYPLGFTRDRGGWWLVAAAFLGIAAARVVLRRPSGVTVVRGAVPPLLAGAGVALAIYAYFFRAEGGGLTDFDARAFWTFGQYITPWVLGASVAAFVVLTLRGFWRDPAFFLTFATYGVFFFYKTRIVPEHFWLTRRFLAVALPGALLLLAGLVHEVAGPRRLARLLTPRGRRDADGVPAWTHAAAALLLAALLVPVGVTFWRASDPVHRHTEYKGLGRQVERLAGVIGDRDLLIVEGRVGASDVHTFALPLAYIHRRSVLVLPTALPPKRQLEEFVRWAGTHYAAVYFLGGGGTNLLSRHLAADIVASDQFTVPEYDAPVNATPAVGTFTMPAGVRHKEFEFGLYRLSPRPTMPSGDIDLTIGTRDDLHVIRFHSKEGRPSQGLVYRWTRDLSHVALLGIAEDARTITVWMSNGNRPDAAPPAVVEAAIDDQVLGTARVGPALAPYTFPLPASVAREAAGSPDPVRLSLRVPTWNPAEMGVGPDTRDLGVQITRVQVQ